MKLRFPAPTVNKEGLENAEVISNGASREIFLGEVSSELALKEGIGAGCVRALRVKPRCDWGSCRHTVSFLSPMESDHQISLI